MNSLITLAYFVMSKSFSLIVHTNYQMTVILSREISSGLSPMSCVQTLQTCLAATCLLVWSHESGQDLTSRVRELMRILIFSQLTCGASLFFFLSWWDTESRQAHACDRAATEIRKNTVDTELLLYVSSLCSGSCHWGGYRTQREYVDEIDLNPSPSPSPLDFRL